MTAVNGLNTKTGGLISDKAHLQQSIADILFTPIGSRVMRRDYGSYLFALIDQAGNAVGRLRLMAATADALMRWEPRLKLNRVDINITQDGCSNIEVAGLYKGALETFSVSNPANSTEDIDRERYQIWQSVQAKKIQEETKPQNQTNN